MTEIILLPKDFVKRVLSHKQSEDKRALIQMQLDFVAEEACLPDPKSYQYIWN